ncbi:IscS subfamily cysteine desulfurase [Fastidiosibacter lacustris]|uniref:IscS subfamily cysteine desulfurase n=1 Tax=Fastidiosibacter lacustris TaxID=2056695 RepID=UPI000E352EC3|nr:IscS subfamily cysteine desulfurase [Fastidiosibacter lacustris]
MKQIYLDYASTTPVAQEVIDEMLKYLSFENIFGNPASNTHEYGWYAKEAVDKARQQVALLICADSREIVFTSGATESDNLAIKGVADAYANKGKHIITSSIEHKAVIDTCAYLETKGYTVSYLVPDQKGQITAEQVMQTIQPDTILVSLMAVNNELGTCYPLAEIGALCKENKILFHVDAAQGFGKIDVDVRAMNIDLLSISAHKIYGPKGVGALYVRRKPKVKLTPLIHGGGHENGYRSGTLATHQIVGLGQACVLMQKKGNSFYRHVENLRAIFLKKIEALPNITINTPLANSYPGIVNITFEGVDGEALVAMLHNLAVSMGSACNSASIEPSFVLLNIGLSQQQAHASLRFSFGQYTTVREVHIAADSVVAAVTKLRALSEQCGMGV